MNKHQVMILGLIIVGIFTLIGLSIWKHTPATHKVVYVCDKGVHEPVMQYNKMCIDDGNHSKTCKTNATELFCEAKSIMIRD